VVVDGRRLHTAALDVHKKSITACVRTPDGHGGRAEQVRTFPTFLYGLVALRGWLLAEHVARVAMEATSSYWVPVWRVLEDGDVCERLVLVNVRHVKHVPGRKTDVKDASWLCQLLEVGLLAGSFVPPPQVRRLRAVTRYRKRLIQARTSETQRVEKTLEDAVVKLGAVQDADQVGTGDDRRADRRAA
jgi:transposase